MKSVAPELSLPEIDQRISKHWQKTDAFQRSNERRRSGQEYLFYDGPPFSSGSPHYGHLLAGTIKDIIPRYQNMRGHYVERRFGWDTHGLPIEMIIEKQLGLNGRTDVLAYGVDKYNEACRAGVLSCVEEWRVVMPRLGRWVDFENDYKTMDLSFMESVWWVFKELYKQGRIYLGKRVMPYSWRLATPLSNFEASSNYKDVQDPAITVRFRLVDRPDVSALAWTTTPWTLPSNLALCAGADIDYVIVEAGAEKLLLAEARLSAYFKKNDQYKILERLKGSQILGYRYQPLFDFFTQTGEASSPNTYTILNDDYVSIADGTGLVHQSPAHGEDDFRIGQKNGLAVFDPVDAEGNFTTQAGPFAGQNIKVADKEIIQTLKQKGLLYKQDTLTHSYPFCERSDTPLIYKAISAWYVRVEDLRERMLQHNATIHWVPEHIKQGRFGNWLANARDWNISRNRFWGTPLPVWLCQKCNEVDCIGSRAELEGRIGKTVTDLHKHFVDSYTWPCEKCGGTMQRTPEVLDCWFESGAMPYAQIHYPFENKERFEAAFPADFIAEGLDQTRGWFYTLLILATALFDKAPFKNVIVNGMILAEDGKKMSKRLKNYPDPMKVLDQYGADALRLYLINSAAVKGEALRLSESGIKDIIRTVLLPYWNVYSFFTTYANIDQYRPSATLTASTNILDRWIISRLQTLLTGIEREMGQYRLYTVVPVMLEFLEELTNWYVRRSRRRFWSDDQVDKQAGYDTLLYVLVNFTQALAPFLPFITEEIYQNLKSELPEQLDSVHFCDYPTADPKLINSDLEQQMALIQQAVALGRSLRSRVNIRTRQPLNSVTVVTSNEADRATLETFKDHILAELNVKQVMFSANEAELLDISVKPNFPVLGPIVGKQMGAVSKELASLDRAAISKLEQGQKISILGFELDLSLLQIVRKARDSAQQLETARGVTVYYDLSLSNNLINEGLARELVNRVQRFRKDSGLNISDRIELAVKADQQLLSAFTEFAEYIKGEVLAVNLQLGTIPGNFKSNHTDIESQPLELGLRLAAGK